MTTSGQSVREESAQAVKRTVAPKGERGEQAVEEAFDRLVAEGVTRLRRPLLPLVATGLLGGIDVGVGVFAYLVVETESKQPLLGALAFTIGFVALLLASSELFTEDFLVPVTAVVAKAGTALGLVRLWVVTVAANLAAGLFMAYLMVTARPDLRPTARELGAHYAHLGVTGQSFCLAVLAGAVITLLTRMQHATDNLGVRIVPAILMSFVLVAGMLFHSVLDSLLMFAGLVSGHADYSWLSWFVAFVWSAFGNIVGGVGLVAGVRFLRVSHRLAEDREKNA